MPTRTDLAKIHIAKKELGLDEETYRGVLWDRYHRESAAELTQRQVLDLLDHFRRLGWRPWAGSGPQRPASFRQLGLIRYLWRRLEASGGVEHPGEAALAAFVGHMTGKESLRRLSVAEASKVIEGLKSWVARAEKLNNSS